MPRNRKERETFEVPNVSIIEACQSADLLNVSLSLAQETHHRAIFGLPIADSQMPIFTEATGFETYAPPEGGYRTTFSICGRRAGKSSRIAAPLACFLSCLVPHPIPPNERGTVLVIGPVARQAKATFKTIHKILSRSPVLRDLIENVKQGGDEWEISLSTRVDIRVVAANSRTVRGDLLVGVILEEGAFFRDSDTEQYNLQEIIDAVRPGLLTIPDSRLICVTSPWAQIGPVWEAYQNRATRLDELCWKLPSWRMNPTLPQKELDKERRRDEAIFLREFGAEFSTANSALLPPEMVDRAVARGVPFFTTNVANRCVAGLDPSSKGNDSFGFALAHKSIDGRIAVDWCQQWTPPGGGRFIDYGYVLPQIMDQMNNYGATQVFSDQICAAALAAEFAKRDFQFTQVGTFGSRAADLYRTVRQLFIAGKVDLPDQPELIAQLKKLEEILSEGGRSVVQARSGHDDLAVAACLAIYEASLLPEYREPMIQCVPLYDYGDEASHDRWFHPVPQH